jgi:MYXO-CTERM domain-containing protein
MGYSATMRNLRSFAVIALSVAPLLTWTAGCGDDEPSSGSSSGAPDSSTNTSSSGGSSGGSSGSTDSSSPPTANATSVTVYVGATAKLDGSTSTGSGLTYAWTLKTAPAGSTITTASLATANTAATTFAPDKVGSYELELTVTSGSQTAKATATVTAVDPPIFYFDNAGDGGTSSARLLVTGATAGEGGKPVACFERDSGTYAVYRAASGGADWWEAPAGQPSKAAFIFEAETDGGQTATLYSTTSTGSCATPPTKLDQVPYEADPIGSVNLKYGFAQPRISPDGQRVAYVRQAPEGARVATIALDGTGLRTLASRFADSDGGADPDASLINSDFAPSRAFWQGNTHVAWIETLSGNNWQLVRAADAASTAREVLAVCSSAIPMMAAFLPSGELLVAQNVNGGSALVAYPIVAATKTCGAARYVTVQPDAGDFDATDFQLSPDGKEVAYLRSGDFATKVAFITKVDGTGTPRRAADVGDSQRGPRFVGNGAFVSWGVKSGQAIDAGTDAGAIIVARAEGGTAEAGPAPVNVPVSDNAAEAIGNGIFQCSFGNAAGSGVAFAGVAGVALLRLLRRRRR